MAPKKKEKSKGPEWLQCSICGRLISGADTEVHVESCDSDHGFIQNKVLHGKLINADSLLNEDGAPITKSVRDKSSVVWVAIPTMQICGLSIGQPCIVNKVMVRRAWPMKSSSLTSVAMTSDCMETLGIKIGDQVMVERFIGGGNSACEAVLRLQEPEELFETEEFCSYVASYLDGKYITKGTPLHIHFFGRICQCHVDSIVCLANTTHTTGTASQSQNLKTISLSNSLDKDTSINCSEQHSLRLTAPSFEEDSSFQNSDHDLSSSFTNMSISSSDAGGNGLTSTPKSLPKPRYPSLQSPCLQMMEKTAADSCSVEFAQVSSSTKISILSTSMSSRGKGDVMSTKFSLKDMGGLSLQIEEIKSRIHRAQQPGCTSRCILLHGPSGSGKTTLARALTTELGLHTVHVVGTDIWSKLFGEAESNLKRLFQSAQDRAPSIIVIDDLDVICPKRSQQGAGQQEHRIVGTLLSQIDGLATAKSPVVIIGVTSNKDVVDPALRRAGRFGCEVELGVPTASQRSEILERMLGKVKTSVSREDIDIVARNAHGYVGADLAALVNEASMHSLNRQMSSCSSPLSAETTVTVTLEDLVYAGLHVKPSALREIQLEVPQVQWSDIGGMAEVKMRLREAVELPLSHPETFVELGIDPPRGLLMYGPPGCSKTMVARALASQCKLNFLAVKGPELFNQYVGESEKAIREVFRKARSAAPSIIFFDEIDAIAGKRGSSSGGSGVDDRVLTQLLTEMDGLEHLKNVFIVAATNRPDKIDRALLRPGRFDNLIYVPLPDSSTRQEILEKKLARMSLGDDVTISTLVGMTEGYSGAEVIQVCQEAALCVLRENISAKIVYQRHYESALGKVRPQIDQELLQIYAEFSSTL